MTKSQYDVLRPIKIALRLNNIYVFFVVNAVTAPPVFISRYHAYISNDLNVNDHAVVFLYGIFYTVAGFSSLIVKKILVRVNIGVLCAIAGSILGIGLWLCSLSLGFFYFFSVFVLVVSALGAAFFQGPIAASVMASSGTVSALSLGVATSGQLTSFAFWAFILDILGPKSWQCAFSAAGGLIVIISALGYFVLIPTRMSVAGRVKTESGNLSIYNVYAIFFLVCLSATDLIMFINFEAQHFSGGAIYVLSIFALLGRLIVPAFFDFGFRRMSVFVSTLIFCAGLISRGIAPLWVPACLCGIGYGGMLPALMTFISIRYPIEKSDSPYKLLIIGSLGVIIGPFLRVMPGYGNVVDPGVAIAIFIITLSLIYFSRDMPK